MRISGRSFPGGAESSCRELGAGRCFKSRALHGEAADAGTAVTQRGDAPSELPAGGEVESLHVHTPPGSLDGDVGEDRQTREWEAALVEMFSEETPIGALTGMRLSFDADGAAGTNIHGSSLFLLRAIATLCPET